LTLNVFEAAVLSQLARICCLLQLCYWWLSPRQTIDS